MTSTLARLTKPFPEAYIHTNPSGGGSYVGHEVITQRLLAALGGYDFELRQIIYEDLPAVAPDPNGKSTRAKNGSHELPRCVVGVVARLTIVVDGERHSYEEAGDCEDPRNWPHNGARMKDAMSDAIKRCAMRTGVAIHLWAGKEFFLDRALQAVPQDAA